MTKYLHKIITNSIDECDRAIHDICRDEKTNYTENSFEIGKDFEVKHLVETQHNVQNFKKKFNQYFIEL